MTVIDVSDKPPDRAAAADDPAINRYIAEALELVNRIRAIAALFPEESEPRRLRPSDLRLANITSAEALEQAAVLAEAAPNVGGSLANVHGLRDTINYLFANAKVREEAVTLLRRIDNTLARKKLRAVKLARALYQVAKVYAASEAGDGVKPHVAQMERTLRRKRRKAAAPAEQAPAPVPAAAVSNK